ncbi:MAG: hypothetical protein ACYSSI_00960 [Planctomycetota bacterium]|jgi:hypothetical protein
MRIRCELVKLSKFISVAVICFLGFLTNSVFGESVQTLTEHVFDLEYKPNGFSLPVSVKVWGQDKKFEKEPTFGERRIVRGLLLAGTEEKDYIGFAWDRSEGKLYLDLNRNRDITDDPNGLFCSDSVRRYQIFRDIHCEVQLDSVRLEFAIQMTIYDFGNIRPHCSVEVFSGFLAQIELYGEKWLLKFADNMDGKITQSDRIVLIPADIDIGLRYKELSSPVPEKIFLDRHNYNVSFEFQSGEKGSSVKAKFIEIDSSVGELKLEGKFIKRLVLEAGSSLVLLDSPKSSVSIPTGKYHWSNLLLDGGESGLFHIERFTARTDDISISETEPATLKIGGPLKGTVDVQRVGRVLELVYKLVGIGGYSYESLRGRPDNPPTFMICKDGKEIASGNFEYG